MLFACSDLLLTFFFFSDPFYSIIHISKSDPLLHPFLQNVLNVLTYLCIFCHLFGFFFLIFLFLQIPFLEFHVFFLSKFFFSKTKMNCHLRKKKSSKKQNNKTISRCFLLLPFLWQKKFSILFQIFSICFLKTNWYSFLCIFNRNSPT